MLQDPAWRDKTKKPATQIADSKVEVAGVERLGANPIVAELFYARDA